MLKNITVIKKINETIEVFKYVLTDKNLTAKQKCQETVTMLKELLADFFGAAFILLYIITVAVFFASYVLFGEKAVEFFNRHFYLGVIVLAILAIPFLFLLLYLLVIPIGAVILAFEKYHEKRKEGLSPVKSFCRAIIYFFAVLIFLLFLVGMWRLGN